MSDVRVNISCDTRPALREMRKLRWRLRMFERRLWWLRVTAPARRALASLSAHWRALAADAGRGRGW